jgi:hypothetical protein
MEVYRNTELLVTCQSSLLIMYVEDAMYFLRSPRALLDEIDLRPFCVQNGSVQLGMKHSCSEMLLVASPITLIKVKMLTVRAPYYILTTKLMPLWEVKTRCGIFPLHHVQRLAE